MEPAEMKEKSITILPGEVFDVAEEEKEEIKYMIKFPQEESWNVSVNLYKYQEFWYHEFVLIGILLSQKKFKPQPTDIFIATNPKSGTTWLKALAFAIQTRTRYINGDVDDHESPLLYKSPHQIVPSLENSYSFGFKRDPTIPFFSTHVSFHSLPDSIKNSDSKIIYIYRDPKDVLVSHFHFISKLHEAPVKPFHEVYEKFCDGVMGCGPFWDHVLEYWKASLKFPQKILFLKYHDLKNDTAYHIKKIADFIGCPFSIDELQQGIVEKIIHLCSFEYLSSLDVNSKNATKVSDDPNVPLKHDAFFRKGKVEDWKNYLTFEMAERIDQITSRKFNGSGFHFR